MESYAVAFVLVPPPADMQDDRASRYSHLMVREIMEPFSAHKRVDPHRIHIPPREADLTAQAYGADPRDMPALAVLINEHTRGSVVSYGADELGLYVVSTTNPVGKWSMWHIPESNLRVPLSVFVGPGTDAEQRPFFFPPHPFAVVTDFPKPAWMQSHEWHGDAGAEGHFAVDRRFMPMLRDLAERIPNYWVIPIRYI